nr:MAG TPA: hypothetical protein [Caudoviricetes sp.]
MSRRIITDYSALTTLLLTCTLFTLFSPSFPLFI